MNDSQTGLLPGAVIAVESGLPELLLHFVVTLALLGAGVAIYMAVTPFRERELIAAGNTAASTVLGGAIISLALPLAAMLATSGRLVDIVVWGIIALVIQLLTVLAVSRIFHHLGKMIEGGNVAAAMVLAATQVGVGLLNAGVMVPN
jgi:putative membrane protein